MKIPKYIPVFVFLALLAVVKFTNNTRSDDNYNPGQDEVFREDCREEQEITSIGLITTRSWTSQNSRSRFYCTNYQTDEIDVANGQSFRQSYYNHYYRTQGEFWGSLYSELYEQDKLALNSVIDSLRQIKIERGLDRTEFAKVVVAFVQDIPYT